MNKPALVSAILERLSEELAQYTRAARAAHAEATDEQSKAENKYDTRGLEASYLAAGQSKQAAETEEARRQFELLVPREFEAGEPVGLGALVEVESAGDSAFYFVGPRAGGTEVQCEGRTVVVVTSHSPLGRELLGRRLGERLNRGPAGKTWVIRAVW